MTSQAEEQIVIKRSRSRMKLCTDVVSKSKRVSFETDYLEDDAVGLQRERAKLFSLEPRFLDKVTVKNVESEKGDSPRKWSSPTHVSLNSNFNLKSTSKRDYPCMLERGVPEGREDPKLYSSASNLSECENDGHAKSTLQ